MVIRLRPFTIASVSAVPGCRLPRHLTDEERAGSGGVPVGQTCVKIAERGEVIGYTLLVESNKFLLSCPPLNWQVRGSPQ